uniref:Uncharacterized protein n=1 Tax=Oryza brachyantha TaxID=4533 RepID=J3LC81_ORYBR
MAAVLWFSSSFYSSHYSLPAGHIMCDVFRTKVEKKWESMRGGVNGVARLFVVVLARRRQRGAGHDIQARRQKGDSQNQMETKPSGLWPVSA